MTFALLTCRHFHKDQEPWRKHYRQYLQKVEIVVVMDGIACFILFMCYVPQEVGITVILHRANPITRTCSYERVGECEGEK